MLKIIIVFFCFSFFSLAFADVKFDEIIKNNIIEESNTASEIQQFAGIQSEDQKNPADDYSAAKAPTKNAVKPKKETRKESDFKVVLRRKSENKIPVVQRSVASKNRVTKVTKKIKRKN